MSWNVLGRERPDPSDLAGYLHGLGADVVVVQEIPRGLAASLRRALGFDHGRWWCKHWSVRYPAEGEAVLSRFPLLRPARVVLASGPLVHHRRRVAGSAWVTTGTGAIRVVVTHLGADIAAPARVRQVRTLVDWLGEDRVRTVVGGDLNAEADSVELAAFADAGLHSAEDMARSGAGVAGPTNWSPGPRHGPPDQRLDYLLVGADVAVRRASTPAAGPADWQRLSSLSDHLPVSADVHLVGRVRE